MHLISPDLRPAVLVEDPQAAIEATPMATIAK
jgi:hypothetical protein